ncbi:2-amino-4-hydroxy-6-hydroxymethyldihydropteridine diphosphokinase [Advenella sp. RU8]|uniref:2-amino-4-hydroxy-6- hydroxymethyldihydropteridine diphosphokinase n=1 Tax=Advenella sp. RU8 TaxID=3399575 RepID=UPI003AAEAECB
MNTAYIGLGSNLGESRNILQQALADISAHPAIHTLACSRFYRSSPVDSSGPDYVNAAAQLETSLSSLDLLHFLQSVENRYGRERPYVNAPRTLDLDILLFNDETNDSAELTLPHPRMHQRAFVLLPLQELAPGLVLAQGPLNTLLEQCKDQGIKLL